eukprot:COSAG06_NODE_1441_length_9454_cov_2.073437_7_plen_63_part_00
MQTALGDGRTVAGKAWGRKRQEGGVTSQRAKNARTLLQPEPEPEPEPEPGSLRVELGCGSQI